MLPEKLYECRRRMGLSQEQLAEQVGVSRQTVSKWETGTSTTELEKLIALSQCFGITVDELVQGVAPAANTSKSTVPKLGPILVLLGGLMLCVFGLIIAFSPEASQIISTSSVITINGTGIAMLIAAVLMAAGILLTIKKK